MKENNLNLKFLNNLSKNKLVKSLPHIKISGKIKLFQTVLVNKIRFLRPTGIYIVHFDHPPPLSFKIHLFSLTNNFFEFIAQKDTFYPFFIVIFLLFSFPFFIFYP